MYNLCKVIDLKCKILKNQFGSNFGGKIKPIIKVSLAHDIALLFTLRNTSIISLKQFKLTQS